MIGIYKHKSQKLYKTKLVVQAERQADKIRKRFLTATERPVCDKLRRLYRKSVERVFRRREM